MVIEICVIFFVAACSGDVENAENIETYVPDTSSNFGQVDALPEYEIIAVDTVFAYQLMESEHGGFGYKIFQYGKLYISQPHIPAVQGMKGFSTQERAITTAVFAISKLQQGIFPPMVTVEELDSLGVVD